MDNRGLGGEHRSLSFARSGRSSHRLSVETTGGAIARAWYLAGVARRIRRRPIGLTVHGTPLVVFWSGTEFGALVDRCPHRGAPLSLGRVEAGGLRCAYHGWLFGSDGACLEIPSRCDGGPSKAFHAEPRPVAEADGLVWVCGEREPPEQPPPSIPVWQNPNYAHVMQVSLMPAGFVDTAENILDVPHTGFLHRGWFRGAPSRRVRVEVERSADSVTARFEGETAPSGLLGRLLAPRARTLEHIDRFRLPCLAEVEYRLGSHHLLLVNALTPSSPTETRVVTLANLRLGYFSGLALAVAGPFARRVLAQDAWILEALTGNRARFPGLRPVSTELDLVGAHISLLLDYKRLGKPVPPHRRDVEMRL